MKTPDEGFEARRPRRSGRALRPLLIAIAAMLLGLLAPRGWAQQLDPQDVPADDAFEMGMNALSRRGIEKYATILKLDDDQKEATRALFDGYIESVRAVSKEIQAFMQELGTKVAETQDYTAYQKEMGPKMKEYQARMEKLQEGFFGDVKSLLREDQAAQWPRLERYRLREELMQMGLVSGSGVDLIAIADKLKIDTDADPALHEQFERYELEVDKPLGVLKQASKEMQEKAFDGMADFDPANPEAMMENYRKMMERLMVPARQVRDLNRQFERLIVPLLPPEQGEKFDSEFKFRSFPRVYRKSHVTRALAAAEGFSDLTADQRKSLEEIGQAYKRDAGPANDKWASELESKENASGGAIMQMWMDGMGGDDASDPVAQARKARREIDDRARERILAVLTEDQRSRLPAKGATPDNPWEDFQALQQEDEGN